MLGIGNRLAAQSELPTLDYIQESWELVILQSTAIFKRLSQTLY